MISRPESDADLIAVVYDTLADESTALDTRAMVALLLVSKKLRACPGKAEIRNLLGRDGAGKVGATRLNRMVREAEMRGYFVHSRGQLPDTRGRQGRYWFVVSGNAVPTT